jgi:hypothetical protein
MYVDMIYVHLDIRIHSFESVYIGLLNEVNARIKHMRMKNELCLVAINDQSLQENSIPCCKSYFHKLKSRFVLWLVPNAVEWKDKVAGNCVLCWHDAASSKDVTFVG